MTFEITYLFSFFFWPYRWIIAGILSFDESDKLFVIYPLKISSKVSPIPVQLITRVQQWIWGGGAGEHKHHLKLAVAVWAKHLVSNIQLDTPGFVYNSVSWGEKDEIQLFPLIKVGNGCKPSPVGVK